MKGRGVSRIVLLLFGLPFLGGGCFVGWMAFGTLSEHYRARRWAVVPATIESTELESHTGDDSTTYEVIARYSYTYEGRRYEGTRVGLHGGSDNVGSWHEDTYRRLDEARQRGVTVPCYVNPRKPEESLLDRELRFGMLAFMLLFATLFTGVGGGVMAAAVYFGRHTKKVEALKAAFADEPWKHRPEWADGRIVPKLGAKAAVAWVFAVFWNLVSSPILFVLPREIVEKRNYLALIGLLFPLVGAGLLVYALRATALRRKFGRSYVQLDTMPGVVGGRLRGRLAVVGQIRGLEQIDVALKCIRTYSTGSGKNRSTHHDTLWSDETRHQASSRFGDTEIRVPFDFQIPYECRPHDDSDSNDRVGWRLEVRGSAPGVDLALDFDVPVFKTAESDEQVGESAARVEGDEDVVSRDECPAPAAIRLAQNDAGEPELHASCWPGLGMFLFLLLFDVVFSGVAVFAFLSVARGDWFMLLFLVVFGGIGLLLTFVLFSMFGSYRITLQPGRLVVRRSLGPFHSTRTVEAADVNGVEWKQCASSGERKWYAVYCRTAPHRRVQIASNIPGALAARWLSRQIEEHLSRPAGRVSPRIRPVDIGKPPPFA